MTSITENAHGLARYAQIAQEQGLVPIVEPEVTLGPGAYTIEETAYWYDAVKAVLLLFMLDSTMMAARDHTCVLSAWAL
jgi:fructose-bisphosphate aldolase class 1